MTFFYRGNGECFKAACHGTMCGLAALFTGYNLIAYALRREPHLARNVVIYTGITALEAVLTSEHLKGEKR